MQSVTVSRQWPLLSAMRSLGMGHWSCHAPDSRLALSGDAAAIMGMDYAIPTSLDDLFSYFVPESAERLQHAFLACMRSGTPIDVEVLLASPRDRSRWVRFVGEAVPASREGESEIHGAVQDITTYKRVREETLRLTMRLTTTLASITEAFVTVDRQGRLTHVNRESERLLVRTAGQLLGRPIYELLGGESQGLLRAQIENALIGNQRTEFEDFYPELDKWLEIRIHPYAEGLAMYLRDVSERRQSQNQLTLLRMGIERINDIVAVARVAGVGVSDASITFVNEAFERQTGFSREEVIGYPPEILRHVMGEDLVKSLAREAFEPNGHTLLRREVLLKRRDGTTYWMDLDVVPVHDDQGQLTHWMAVGRDVTERRLAEEKIHHLAFFDSLTGLPNRQLLMERLEETLSDCAKTGQEGALMFIDLDNFKVLNDTMGHSHGDLLLKRVAERLSQCLRDSDTVARIGGDEFVILLRGLGTDPEAAAVKTQAVASKILARMSEPFELGDDYMHYSTTSIGVTRFGAGRGEVSELLMQADLAMYQSKDMNGNTIAFFNPAMQDAIHASAALSADLRVAMQAGGQFTVNYQPLFDRVRRIVGVEALLRWRHPVRGMIPPTEFIPVAENTGLIHALGLWVLEQACARLAVWARSPETAHLGISVNVSVRQFRHPEFVNQVMSTISHYHVQPRLLRLELTESLLIDRLDITLARMHALKQLGVSFSLDDFGTGYSSLSYLKRLPLDQLKIDKSFVADLLTDPSDVAIARTVIELAHSLRLPVVAEGVETEAQYEFLVECGCDRFQGFLLACPMPAENLETFIQAQMLH